MSKIENLCNPSFLTMESYAPIEPPDQIAKRLGMDESEIIKLDANENPFGIDPKIYEELDKAKYLHIYPDPAQVQLREAIASYAGVHADQIIAGTGADELIDLIMRLFIQPGDEVLSFGPTFGYYDHVCSLNHGSFKLLPRRLDFSIDLEEAKKVDLSKTKLVILCSPNNPSGNLVAEEVLDYFLSQDVIVMLDEAYYEFAEQSFVYKVENNPNLILLRTFSKCFALAGFRVGYAITAQPIAKLLMRIKPPYSVNVAAEIALKACLNNWPHFEAQIQELQETRDHLFEELSKLEEVTAYPSKSNFILVRLHHKDASQMKKDLENEGILVRYFAKAPLDNCIRISMGTGEQTNKFLNSFLQKLKA